MSQVLARLLLTDDGSKGQVCLVLVASLPHTSHWPSHLLFCPIRSPKLACPSVKCPKNFQLVNCPSCCYAHYFPNCDYVQGRKYSCR